MVKWIHSQIYIHTYSRIRELGRGEVTMVKIDATNYLYKVYKIRKKEGKGEKLERRRDEKKKKR